MSLLQMISLINLVIFVSLGTIVTARKFDREWQREYAVTVTATDQAADPLIGICQLTIHILDQNDNNPKFENIRYECKKKVHAHNRVHAHTHTDMHTHAHTCSFSVIGSHQCFIQYRVIFTSTHEMSSNVPPSLIGLNLTMNYIRVPHCNQYQDFVAQFNVMTSKHRREASCLLL